MYMRLDEYVGAQELEGFFRALADRTRLRVVNLLLHGELCGCDIQYVLQASQPNVSRHLTYLKNAGLVLDRRDGYRVFYRLAQPGKRIRKQLFSFLRSAFAYDAALRRDAQKLKKSVEHGSCTVSEWRPFAGLVQIRTAASSRT